MAQTPEVRSLEMGDNYNVNQAGAVGPGARATNTLFNNQEAISIGVLAEELERVLITAKAQAGPSQKPSLRALSEATEVARSGNLNGTLEKLETAGGWALEIATKIGTTVAAEAINKALGLK
jgi:hypothetical protein